MQAVVCATGLFWATPCFMLPRVVARSSTLSLVMAADPVLLQAAWLPVPYWAVCMTTGCVRSQSTCLPRLFLSHLASVELFSALEGAEEGGGLAKATGRSKLVTESFIPHWGCPTCGRDALSFSASSRTGQPPSCQQCTARMGSWMSLTSDAWCFS